MVRADVADGQRMAMEFAGAGWVVHFAALGDIVPSLERPSAYIRAGVMGTLGALEGARAAGVQRFVYSASSSCYGIPDQYPTPETALIRTEYPYALSKHLGEQLVLHWARVYRLPVVSLRYFNVYGPRSRTSGAYGAGPAGSCERGVGTGLKNIDYWRAAPLWTVEKIEAAPREWFRRLA